MGADRNTRLPSRPPLRLPVAVTCLDSSIVLIITPLSTKQAAESTAVYCAVQQQVHRLC